MGREDTLLHDFYFCNAGVDLVPAEHLAADGIDGDFAGFLAGRPGWSRGHVDVLEKGIALYVERFDDLVDRAGGFLPPRLRNIAVLHPTADVRPWAALLNESASALRLDDLDPDRSHPEFVSYALALAEHLTETGDVVLAPLQLAPWWFERTTAQCVAFTRAAQGRTSPDASFYETVADAVATLRRLRHRRLRPARRTDRSLPLAGTEIQVPRNQRADLDRFAERLRQSATLCLENFHRRHRSIDRSGARDLVAWLAETRPTLLVTDRTGKAIWDPERAGETEALEAQLAGSGPDTLADLRLDLERISDHTSRFLAAVRNPDSLPDTDPDSAQTGYSFLHRDRRMIAYNLDESGIERKLGPALPWAREMLGARTAHEWAHLAVDAGWVPRTLDGSAWQKRRSELARAFDDITAGLPPAVARETAEDRRRLGASGSVGHALVEIFEKRLPDYRANLLAARFQSPTERETYVRHNIRPLHRELPDPMILRRLARLIFEAQYLRLADLDERWPYFFEITRFESEFLETGILDDAALENLDAAAAALCDAHRIEDAAFLVPAPSA